VFAAKAAGRNQVILASPHAELIRPEVPEVR
jgi:hypothetical protein